MKKIILKYLHILQQIENFKNEFQCSTTPYALEEQRVKVHRELFDGLTPFLDMAEGYSMEDAYVRSKEIFSNLDKVYHIFVYAPFNLQDEECINDLAKILDVFLLKTETLFFLEHKTAYIHGIHLT